MARTSTLRIKQMKAKQDKIVMITCYDATFATLLELSGVDILFVGDSLGVVIKGEENTLNVTLEEIVYHTRAVCRGSQRCHILADMPFLSYQASDELAILNAGKLLQAGAQAVKLEGGQELAPRVKKITQMGIPVMGHIGLMPQSVHALGGYVIQGKTVESRHKLIEDALALQDAGAYAIVLEGVQKDVAALITKELQIPTIGIGAGASCDGQVLVLQDLLHLNPDFNPKFIKRYANMGSLVTDACRNFCSEVKQGTFPTDEHSFL